MVVLYATTSAASGGESTGGDNDIATTLLAAQITLQSCLNQIPCITPLLNQSSDEGAIEARLFQL